MDSKGRREGESVEDRMSEILSLGKFFSGNGCMNKTELIEKTMDILMGKGYFFMVFHTLTHTKKTDVQ